MPDALARLRASHEDLELTLLHFEPPDGLTQLAAGDVDAVVTHRYPGVTWSPPTGVRVTSLMTDALMLLVPADHRLAGRRRVELGNLRDETFISGTPGDANRVALATACASSGFVPNVAFETIDYAATARLVERGFGIALVPRLAWPSSTRRLIRLSLRVDGRVVTRELAFAHRTGGPSPLVDELRRHLTGGRSSGR